MTALVLKPALASARLALALLALYGAIAIYLYERSAKPFASVLTGAAVVLDGDTLIVSGKEVRLLNVDAPEIDQTCGEDRSKLWFCGESAADALKAHLRSGTVRCQLRGYDAARHLLGLCAFIDGSEINAWLVREGWAIATGIGDMYKPEESDARLAKRGIWSAIFVTPRQWREQGFHDTKLNYGD